MLRFADVSDEHSAIGRRDALQRVAIGIGAMVVVPPGAPPHPIHRHLRDADGIVSAHAQANAAEYSPTFVDAHQLATVRALAEAIVPGSTDARSAMQRAHLSWRQLTEQQQQELLSFASTAQPGASNAPDSRVTIRDRFEQLKGWTVGAYYSSERGMRELGWTGNVIFPAFPGCEHADGHA
jgi:hypothetical protein